MKLSVNFIAKGKCYRAGDNIPDAEVPAFVARYMMANADADADSAGNAQGLRQQRANADQRTYEPEPVRTRQGVSAKPQRAKPPASQRYVRRGVAFVPVSDSIELGPGEKLYVREKGRVPPRFVRVGRVREPETAIWSSRRMPFFAYTVGSVRPFASSKGPEAALARCC